MSPQRRAKTWAVVGLLLGVAVCAVVVIIAVIGGAKAEVTGSTPEERAASVSRIASKRPLGARRALLAAVADDSPVVRKRAVASLAHFARKEDRPAVEEATRDADAGVRATAADTMGVFGDGQAADVLVKLIRTDPDEQVCLSALRGLAKCDDPRSIAVLLDTAEKGRSKQIRLQAMKFLSWKFKANLRAMRNVSNQAAWRDLIQRWKWDKRVRDAYAAAGMEIVDRPQDILGRDWHPDRHKYLGTAGQKKNNE